MFDNADKPMLDCHENTTLKLGHADLHRWLTIRCTGRAYPPADVIIWKWDDVIIASNDIIVNNVGDAAVTNSDSKTKAPRVISPATIA